MWQVIPRWHSLSRRALEALTRPDARPQVVRWVAPPGFGEPKLLDQLCGEPGRHRFIRLKARSSYRGVRMLEDLHRLLQLRSLGGAVDHRIAVVAAALCAREIRGLVIDDAGFVSRRLRSAVTVLEQLCPQAGCSAIL